MKKFRIGFFAVLCMFFCVLILQNGLGQDAPALEVMEPAVCTGIEDRACVDPKEEFSSGVERLYCFTRITGAGEDTEVTHVWYYGNIERARVALSVRSASFRTYSSKRMQAHEIGQWRVEVLGPDGTVLKTIPFSIVR
jgi:hypothetical protein